MQRAKVEISGNSPVLCSNEGSWETYVHPKTQTCLWKSHTVVVNDKPGSASCSKEIVGVANMAMNEHEVLTSDLVSCPVKDDYRYSLNDTVIQQKSLTPEIQSYLSPYCAWLKLSDVK